jgi:hypothetical protein
MAEPIANSRNACNARNACDGPLYKKAGPLVELVARLF